MKQSWDYWRSSTWTEQQNFQGRNHQHRETCGTVEPHNKKCFRQLFFSLCRWLFFACWQVLIPRQSTWGVNRTPCHIACTDVNTVSTQHIALICYTLTSGSCCAFHKIVLPSTVPRHVSRPAQYTHHFDLISLFSTCPSHNGSGSRLIASGTHCADSRGLRGNGFTDPEPRTGYEPNRTVDNPIVIRIPQWVE